MVGEHSMPCEGVPRGMLEEMEESMLALVAINQVRNLITENLRVPE